MRARENRRPSPQEPSRPVLARGSAPLLRARQERERAGPIERQAAALAAA